MSTRINMRPPRSPRPWMYASGSPTPNSGAGFICSGASVITSDWCAHHFDFLAPDLATSLPETLDHMRAHHPVAWSEKYGGFWVISSYEEVLRVAQDWETFSNEHGITVPSGPTSVPAIPEQVDPPLHREYKRLVNRWFTPAAVAPLEDGARRIATELVDTFDGSGSAEIMADFALPFPGLVFFVGWLTWGWWRSSRPLPRGHPGDRRVRLWCGQFALLERTLLPRRAAEA